MNDAFALLILVGIVIFACVIAGAFLGDLGDGVLEDRESSRSLARQEARADAAYEERLTAEEETAQAEAEVARAREEKEKEEAYARQMEQTVQLEKARGQRAQDEADAYTTERMADAAYKAIQRQGFLLTLSTAQSAVFAAVLGAAVLILSVILFVEVSKRKQGQGEVTVYPTSQESPGRGYISCTLRPKEKEKDPFPFKAD